MLNKMVYFISTLLWELKFYFRRDHSQFGEQPFLMSALEVDLKKCGYIDIGAHTPVKCSNSYFLYKLGNRGIAVDAIASFRLHWKLWRPRDTYLSFVVVDSMSSQNEFMEFFQASRSRELVSTVLEEQRILWQSQGVQFHTRYVKTISITELLKTYQEKFDAPPGIVFMDVEGLDEMLVRELDNVSEVSLLPRFIFFETLGQKSDINLKNYALKAKFEPDKTNHAQSLLYEITNRSWHVSEH